MKPVTYLLLILALSNPAYAGGSGLTGLFDGGGLSVAPMQERLADANFTKISAVEQIKFRSVGTMAIYADRGMTRTGGCTASLIAGTADDQAPVYVLTAGHCVANPKLLPGEILSDKKILFGQFETRALPTAQGPGLSYLFMSITYAVQDGHDLAILGLGLTAGELRKNGLGVYTLQASPAATGTGIEAVGYSPLLGEALHRSECELESYVYGSEYRHHCSTVPGMSGSPVFSKISGQIIGVTSTTFTGYNTASPVAVLATCFDAQGKFELSLPGCTLPRPCSNQLGCLKDSCAGGNGRACFDLGEHSQQKGGRIPFSVQSAAAFHRQACELGMAKSCARVGELYTMATEAVKSSELPDPEQKAGGYFAKACALGDTNGCANLGWLSERGAGGVKQDTAQAFELYTKACARHDRSGCQYLGGLYDAGKVVPQSFEKALPAFETACDFNGAYACATVGYYYSDGLGVAIDLSKAIQAFDKACALGNKNGCDEAAKLRLGGT